MPLFWLLHPRIICRKNFLNLFILNKILRTINTIMKNANIMSGVVTIGDIDIQEISISDLYKHVLYIPQDTFLFDGTVFDNISSYF